MREILCNSRTNFAGSGSSAITRPDVPTALAPTSVVATPFFCANVDIHVARLQRVSQNGGNVVAKTGESEIARFRYQGITQRERIHRPSATCRLFAMRSIERLVRRTPSLERQFPRESQVLVIGAFCSQAQPVRCGIQLLPERFGVKRDGPALEKAEPSIDGLFWAPVRTEEKGNPSRRVLTGVRPRRLFKSHNLNSCAELLWRSRLLLFS